MNFRENVLEYTSVYRLWQAPFAEQKFRPILCHNDLGKVRRVLDVACGPGTNAAHFSKADYLGIDFNERYIQDARRRYGRNFEVADARYYSVDLKNRYDFILLNSFLHHLNTKDVNSVLKNLRSLLAPEGFIHILELVLPEKRSIARTLARWDRGKFARPLQEWEKIFAELFEILVFEPYSLNGVGATLWNMVYFKGRAQI